MSKQPFSVSVQGQNLFGTHYSPDNRDNKKPAFIIFLHGWAGYRIGPHGMFVEYAQKLGLLGFDSLLFDFRGRGFSQGEAIDTTLNTMMADLEEVMKFVNDQYKPAKIMFIGICSGAKLALYYAKTGKLPVDHIIELSSPTLWSGNESEIELKRTKNLISTYTGKVFEASTWKKLFQGKVNYMKISRMILHSASRSLVVGKRKTTPAANRAKKKTRAFEKFEGHILMIHGEKDPETTAATGQITSFLNKHEISHEIKIIKGANHSFYSMLWKHQIYDAIIFYLNGNDMVHDTDLTDQQYQLKTL